MSRTPIHRLLLRALQSARHKKLTSCCFPLPTSKQQFNLNRRRFLATTAAVSAANLLNIKTPQASQLIHEAHKRADIDVAIIGGGIAGLNAAYQLKKYGIEATVYEASKRLGGRILSRTGAVGEGLITEFGAEFINSDHEDMLALIDDLGLELFNRPDYAARFGFPTSGFFFEGKVWQEHEIADLLGPLADQINNDAANLDEDWDSYAPQYDLLSVADYLNMHTSLILHPMIRRLIENAIRSEYGAEPQDSTSLQLLFMLPTVDGQSVDLLSYSDEAFTIQGGNSTLIDRLATALGGQIRKSMQLTKIKRVSHKRCQLYFRNGHIETADYVIIAVPFSVLRKVEMQIALPGEFQRFVNELDLGHNDKLIAGFSEKMWLQQNSFVGDAWIDADYSLVWDATQRQTERSDGALTFYMGGDEVKTHHDEEKNKDDDYKYKHKLLKRFVSQLDEYLPGSQQAATGKYARTRWTQNRWTKGAYANFKPGQLTEFGDFFWIESTDPTDSQEVRFGNVIFAGEQVSDEYYGFMNGGAQTGRLSAQSLINSLFEQQHKSSFV